MTNKQLLGQFFTTNALDMIESLIDNIPEEDTVIDPFAGNWDILKLFSNRNEIKAYDIEPKNDKTIQRDTLKNPLDYSDLWVVTNPPYLARNKAINKELFDKYKLNDLYKISLKTIVDGNAKGGILVIPTNFLFGKEHEDIRMIFFEKYNIFNVDVYEKRIFEDTSSTVCVFFFKKKDIEIHEDFNVDVTFIPSGDVINFLYEKELNYSIYRSIIQTKTGNYSTAKRVLENNADSKYITNIVINCLDSASGVESIKATLEEKPYIGKKTDRTRFTPIFEGRILTTEEQKKIVELFNVKISNLRNEYHSSFLSYYREGTRKRLDFETAYILLEDCVSEL